MHQGSLSNLKSGLKALVFFFLFLLGLLESGILTIILFRLFHISYEIFGNLGNAVNPQLILAIRISSLIQNVFLFLIPTLILAYLCDKRNERGVLNSGILKTEEFILIFLLWFAIYPFITKIGIWNENMVLPKSLSHIEQWIKSSENQTDKIIQIMLETKKWESLLLNILFMALIPAIGEEFFFRGAIQTLLVKAIRKEHVAIWIGAIFFSFIHFQFYGFFPRLVLGLILGYLFNWSRSLWPGVFFHFLNNGIQIILSFFSKGDVDKVFPEWVEKPGIFLVLCSVLLSMVLSWLIKKSFVSRSAQ